MCTTKNRQGEWAPWLNIIIIIIIIIMMIIIIVSCMFLMIAIL